MDKSLLEKSFEIRDERRLRSKNLILLLFVAFSSILLKFSPTCKYIFWIFSKNESIQILYCDTAFRIAVASCCYLLLIFLLTNCWRTRINVTENELSLLGIKSLDGSVDVCKSNENSVQNLSRNSELNVSQSHNDSALLRNDNNLKSFQGNYSQEFNEDSINFSKYKSMNLEDSSKTQTSNCRANESNYFIDLMNSNFSFNFPFKSNLKKIMPTMNYNNYSEDLKYKINEQDGDRKQYYSGYKNVQKQPKERKFNDTKFTVVDFELTDSEKNRFIINTRKWISHTILEKLVSEIDNVNKYFRKIGMFEYLIGEASCSTLSWFLAKNSTIPELSNLKTILLFLDISNNQRYLVHRLNELITDVSLSKYIHSAGSRSLNNNWNSDLPSDSKIVMHLFLTYLDTHYPKTVHNDQRPFSKQYFIKDATEKSLKHIKSQDFAIISDNAHYSLLLKDKLIQCEKNNDNVFICLVYLIIFVKYHLKGYAGSLCLGKGGLNMLNIIQ
ncbi:MAG: hypothetical protein MHMPM18_002003 [Marteilia pararefringens]